MRERRVLGNSLISHSGNRVNVNAIQHAQNKEEEIQVFNFFPSVSSVPEENPGQPEGKAKSHSL